MNTSNARLWLMWSVAVLFFAYQFIMRVAPGLVMPELMQRFQIDAASFGFFASTYYLGYAGMQIPVALLLDRYGPKIVISICAFICAFGTITMVSTNNWTLALISRFLIGAGSAAGFLGASKIISLWFPEKMYTKMVGVTFTFGLLGALYGGKPIGSLITIFGWDTVLTLVGLIGFGMAAILFLLIKKPDLIKETSERSSYNNLKTIVRDRKLIAIAIANLLMVGALEGFADVWGVSYLVEARNISKSDAALLISTIFFGMLFGGPLLAYIADKLKSDSKVTIVSGFLMSSIFIGMLTFNQNLNFPTLYVLLFMIGILCCYQVLVFSMGVRIVPSHLSGITVAFLNCINMLGGSFFHGIIGQLMDIFWTGSFDNNMKLYNIETYTYALSIIPLAALVGSSILIWVGRKEKPIFIEVVSAKSI